MSESNLKFIGNVDISNKIMDSFLSNTLSHATIIYGNQGIGKSTFVYYLVNKLFYHLSMNQKSLNHQNLIINKTHPNFKIIDREINEKTNKISSYITINQIRNLKPFTQQSSISDLPKIILIDNADQLNINAANALLKILEEPKKNTYFFLISHQLSALLPPFESKV